MKNKFLSFIIMFVASAVTFSCQDEFTEEDALNAQQTIDLAIYVFNAGSSEEAPVVGATVTLIQGGATLEVITDDLGVALFPSAQIGGYIYSVSGDNFTTVTDNGSLNTNNFRQGQETLAVGVYVDGSDNTATIKGRIAIEKDLTNGVTEYADGIELLAIVYLDNDTKTFVVTTDSEGRYELVVPSDFNQQTQIGLKFPDLELDQTLVYSKLSSESGSFPEVLPSVQQYPALFTMYTGGAQNYNNFPSFDYEAVYAIADDAPVDGTTAIINNIIVNNNGEITGINFSNGGDYTGDADGFVNVTFTSLTGGVGASMVFDLLNSTSLSFNYCCIQEFTLVGGSGYSDDFLNRNNYEGPSLDRSDRTQYLYVYPGTTTIYNADYGTGIYREDNLD